MHLREQKGYTYGVGSGLSAQLYRGDWQASMAVRTDVTDPALTDLLDEIRQMREVPVPARELADAKRSLVSSFALSLENPTAVLNNYVTLWIYKLPADYWDTYPQRIEAISQRPEDFSDTEKREAFEQLKGGLNDGWPPSWRSMSPAIRV